MTLLKTITIGLFAVFGLMNAANSALLYSDRADFENQLGASITDDYSKSLYTDFIYSDIAMSAVVGETRYESTGFTDLNIVTDAGNYCAGCNGSFLLDFTSTSVGTADGVFGVGLDISSPENAFNTTAFVTYGDGSTMNYLLPDANLSTGDIFWGITGDLLISSIHFGLIDGGINTDTFLQRMALDNLTIGSKAAAAAVPEVSAVALFGLAIIGFFAARRR